MNDIQIFENGEQCMLTRSKEASTIRWGYVYALEFGDKVKIGCTIDASNRFKQLKLSANYSEVSIGRFAVSPLHSNYKKNERELHEIFKDTRIASTELFKISFDDAVEKMKCLTFSEDKYDEKDALDLEALKRLLLFGPVKSEEHRYPYYIKYCGVNVPIASNAVYIRCTECGKEFDVSIDQILDEDGCLREECDWFCSKECHNKWAEKRDVKINWTQSPAACDLNDKLKALLVIYVATIDAYPYRFAEYTTPQIVYAIKTYANIQLGKDEEEQLVKAIDKFNVGGEVKS